MRFPLNISDRSDEVEFIGTEQTIKLNVVPDEPNNPSAVITVNILIVGPDDPLGPAITDDLVVAAPDSTQPLNPLFNDTTGTGGFDLPSFTIEQIDGLEIGEGGNSDWTPASGEQSTTYEICDNDAVCATGTVRFVLCSRYG